jgi:hypothetical protein
MRWRNMEALSEQCLAASSVPALQAASQVGKTIVGGIDLNKARMRQVIEAVIVYLPCPTASPPPSWRLRWPHWADTANLPTAPVRLPTI